MYKYYVHSLYHFNNTNFHTMNVNDLFKTFNYINILIVGYNIEKYVGNVKLI